MLFRLVRLLAPLMTSCWLFGHDGYCVYERCTYCDWKLPTDE